MLTDEELDNAGWILDDSGDSDGIDDSEFTLNWITDHSYDSDDSDLSDLSYLSDIREGTDVSR